MDRYGGMINDDDDTQRFHYHSESYRFYPVDMEVISWLGAYFVKSEMYEKVCSILLSSCFYCCWQAMAYFIRASQIQPKEVKWRLMIASCYRRIGNFQQALKIYEVCGFLFAYPKRSGTGLETRRTLRRSIRTIQSASTIWFGSAPSWGCTRRWRSMPPDSPRPRGNSNEPSRPLL